MTNMLVFFSVYFFYDNSFFFLCSFLSLIGVGNFLAPFLLSFLVLGTSQIIQDDWLLLSSMPYINGQETLKAPHHYGKISLQFAILSLEMFLLSNSCIQDHAYISRGRENFMSSIAMVIL